MKKLDHNEAVKALREGKKIKAHCGIYFASHVDVANFSDCFVDAEYFTLEEPEEQKEKSLSEIVCNELPWPEVSDFVSHIGLRHILCAFAQELDKRYMRK